MEPTSSVVRSMPSCGCSGSFRSTGVGPVGDVPAAWLPDGALILQDEQPRDGYPKSRLDLLRPDGAVVRLGAGGFGGVLDPHGATSGRTPAG